ncbi:MAG: hypothetical protein ACK4S0_08625 [Sediminibacterium sp.]
MTNQQLAQQFAEDFINAQSDTVAQLNSELGSTPEGLLDQLIDAIPYYQDPAFMNLHRGGLINMLETYLPNNAIEPQGNDSGWDYNTSYSYWGSYSGYQNAFYTNITANPAANAIVNELNSNQPPFWTETFMNKFAVIVLTDAVRQKNAAGVNTGSLATDLASYNQSLNLQLAQTYLAIFQNVYQPTQLAIQNITSSGNTDVVCNLIVSTLNPNSSLVTDLNIALANPDSAVAATWFIYNLCIILKILQCSDISTVLANSGLTLPSEFNNSGWWTGQYTSWFVGLSGSDVMNDAGNMITASLPEQSVTIFAGTGGQPQTSYPNVSNGYSQSLCNWGPLNYYNPPPSSCFGKGTMVLMSDNSTRPIELIEKGDIVHTQLGPRKVVLVETPKRMGRKLIKIDQLNMSFTIAHPLISAEKKTGKYLAVDPWGLIDGIPTSTLDGVVTLGSGSRLQALKDSAEASYSVQEIQEISNEKEGELVYDLILENWETDMPCYYVGGPEYFIATEAETVHPLQEPLVSTAIIASLNKVRDVSRNKIKNPEASLHHLIYNLDLEELKKSAFDKLSQDVSGEEISFPSIPKPDFYYYEGKWDVHASLLEYYLVRYYGRWLRSEIYNGWRNNLSTGDKGNLIIDLNDLELIDAPLVANRLFELKFSLRDQDRKITHVINHSEALAGNPFWRVHFDKSLVIGESEMRFQKGFLSGDIYCDETLAGSFNIAITPGMQSVQGSDLFIYNSDNKIIGRVNLALRILSKTALLDESTQHELWTGQKMWNYSLILGNLLGDKLVDLIEERNKIAG